MVYQKDLGKKKCTMSKTVACVHRRFGLLFVWAALIPAALFADSQTPEYVFQAFRSSYNWLDSVALHARSVLSMSTDMGEEDVRDFDFYAEGGDQFNMKGSLYTTSSSTNISVTPKISFQHIFSQKTTAGYFCDLQFSPNGDVEDRGSLRIYESDLDESILRLDRNIFAGPIFLGASFPFSKKRIPDLVSQNTASIREVLSDGLSYIVLEGELPEGCVAIWLSPDKAYALEKCVLTKEAGVHLDYSGELFSHNNGLYDPPRAVTRSVLEIEILESKKSGLYYIPTKIKQHYVEEFKDPPHYQYSITTEVSDFDLKPDFDALKAFDFYVPENTYTSLIKSDGTLLTGFKWEDGKLVADVDADALDNNIRTALSQIKTGSPSKNKVGIRFQMDGLDGASGFLFRHGRLLTWISGALFLLACGVCVAYVVLKNRKQVIDQK